VIAVAYGTAAEVIKLAPVLIGLEERGARPLTLCVAQQAGQLPAALADFGLPQPDLWIARGHNGSDLERPVHIPRWVGGAAATFARQRRALRERLAADPGRPLMMVHGDTMTTVIGALMGRAMRLPVAHVEAGMRSGNWRNPFPEEFDRRIAARLTDLHFAPNERAADNLRRAAVKGQIVETAANTILDALRLASATATPAVELPDESFGLVSIHRTELLENRAELRATLEVLHKASRRIPLLFVEHTITVAAIRVARLGHLFDDRFRPIPRQRYPQFIALLRRSAFLVSDSGGSQEECAYLGHPCLIHRAVSEHSTGLDGGSVVLSRMRPDVLRDFLADPARHRRPPVAPHLSPTRTILDTLEAEGFLVTARRAASGLAGARR
jgi:UDP-N-acetylglucosamine 2-epimerase (non-hydrolysing)